MPVRYQLSRDIEGETILGFAWLASVFLGPVTSVLSIKYPKQFLLSLRMEICSLGYLPEL